jgi:hypothetical protein
MLLHIPHASRSLHIPSMLPSIAAACFWLVVAFNVIDRRPSKAVVYFIFIYFLSLNSTPQTMGRCPPTHSPPHVPLL